MTSKIRFFFIFPNIKSVCLQNFPIQPTDFVSSVGTVLLEFNAETLVGNGGEIRAESLNYPFLPEPDGWLVEIGP